MQASQSCARERWAVVALLALFALLIAGTVTQLAPNYDEPLYLNTGRALVHGSSWEHRWLRFHGPLPLYANQLLVFQVPREQWDAAEVEPWMARARLGMLPFALLAAWCVWRWSRSLFGARGALFALGLFVLNPITIGYGGLLNVDMAHAALTVLSAWLAWRLLERASWGACIALGAAVGALLATKYSALLSLPGLALLAAWAGWRSTSGSGSSLLRRAARALGVLLLIAAAGLLVLHACYQFRAGFASAAPEDYQNGVLRAVASLPLAGPLLGLLPRAFAQGVDMLAADDASQSHVMYSMGSFAEGHPSYYVWTFLLKTPELLLVLLAPLAWWALSALRTPGPVRLALLAMALIALPALLYLSLFTKIQAGVRYVLQYYPLLFVLYGALAASAWVERWSAARRVWVAGCMALLLSLDLAANYPNLIAYYNRLLGGQAQAWRFFNDSNSEFGQLRDAGWEQLLASEREPFERLHANVGGRTGRLAIHILERVVPDPEHPDREWHWLDAFEAQRHLDASWWIYEISEAQFRAAAQGADERLRTEFVRALLGERAAGAPQIAEARVLLASLPAERAAPLLELADALQDSGADPATADERLRLAQACFAAGRPDRCAELLDRPDADSRALLLAGDAYQRMQRFAEAARCLDRPELWSMDALTLLLAAQSRARSGAEPRAIELLELGRALLEATAPGLTDRSLAPLLERQSALPDYLRRP